MRTYHFFHTMAAVLLIAVLATAFTADVEEPLSSTVEEVPSWYLNPPVEPDRIYGVGISDATGNLLIMDISSCPVSLKCPLLLRIICHKPFDPGS